MFRRLMLVGVFALLYRGSLTQLVFGTAFSAVFLRTSAAIAPPGIVCMMGEEILGVRGLPGARTPACAVGLPKQNPPIQSMPPPSPYKAHTQTTHSATSVPKVRAGGTAKAARTRVQERAPATSYRATHAMQDWRNSPVWSCVCRSTVGSVLPPSD